MKIPILSAVLSKNTIQKIISTGTAQWAVKISGTGDDVPQFVTTDSSGNVYIVGYYNSPSLTFYNSDGNSTISNLTTNSGSNDVFLVKYNSNGTAQWASRIAGTGNDQAYCVEKDSSGNVYIIGTYGSTLTFYNADGNSSGLTLSIVGVATNDIFIAKYNSSGSVQWATRIGGTQNDAGKGISIDSSGYVYVTGTFSSATANIYNAPGNGSTALTLTNSNSGANDVFLVKYDSSGVAQWATKIGGTVNDFVNCVTTDSSGNVYVTGYFQSATANIYNAPGNGSPAFSLTNIGGSDLFMVKYDSSGTSQWATKIGGTGTEIGYSVATHSTGNVYLTGTNSSITANIYNANEQDSGLKISGSGSFIVKYDSSGSAQWVTKIGSGNGDVAQSIKTDWSGNVYVTGYFSSASMSIYSAPGNTSSGLTALTNSGSNDIFMIKYNSSGAAQWATRIGGTGDDRSYCVSSDSIGNIYLTGTYKSATTNIYNVPGNGSAALSLTNSDITTNDGFIVKFS